MAGVPTQSHPEPAATPSPSTPGDDMWLPHLVRVHCPLFPKQCTGAAAPLQDMGPQPCWGMGSSQAPSPLPLWPPTSLQRKTSGSRDAGRGVSGIPELPCRAAGGGQSVVTCPGTITVLRGAGGGKPVWILASKGHRGPTMPGLHPSPPSPASPHPPCSHSPTSAAGAPGAACAWRWAGRS